MNSTVEDFAGRSAILAVFSMATTEQVVALAALARSDQPINPLTLISMIASLIFLTMAVGFTLIRFPAKTSAAGIEPRITAIIGTFLMSGLISLPAGSIPDGVRLLATVMTVVGTSLAAVCLCWLGRSFSVMATARKLVTTGPYSYVRHPLYAAEAITVVGITIGNWSWASALVCLCWFALQYRRALNEERVLRLAFPEYQAYARQVPMLFPLTVSMPASLRR